MKDTRLRAILVIGVVLLVINVTVTGYAVIGLQSADSRLDGVESRQQAIENAILQTGEETDNAQTGGNAAVSVTQCTGDIMAVEEDGLETTGATISYTYQPLPGGSIYFDMSEVDIDQEFQEATRNAQTAVTDSSYSPRMTGLRVKMDTPEQWSYVSGASAGVEIASMLAAQDPRYSRNQTVAATGKVSPQGNIEEVAAEKQKAIEARQQGYSTFVVPEYTPDLDVNGITVIRAGTIQEAFNHTLDQGTGATLTEPQVTSPQKTPHC